MLILLLLFDLFFLVKINEQEITANTDEFCLRMVVEELLDHLLHVLRLVTNVLLSVLREFLLGELLEEFPKRLDNALLALLAQTFAKVDIVHQASAALLTQAIDHRIHGQESLLQFLPVTITQLKCSMETRRTHQAANLGVRQMVALLVVMHLLHLGQQPAVANNEQNGTSARDALNGQATIS